MEVTRIRELTHPAFARENVVCLFVEMEVTRIRELTQDLLSLFRSSFKVEKEATRKKGIGTILLSWLCWKCQHNPTIFKT